MPDLLPCPFCGGKPVYTILGIPALTCGQCGAAVPGHPVGGETGEMARYAAARWNARIPAGPGQVAAVRALVEALETIASENCGSDSPDLVDHVDYARSVARLALQGVIIR